MQLEVIKLVWLTLVPGKYSPSLRSYIMVSFHWLESTFSPGFLSSLSCLMTSWVSGGREEREGEEESGEGGRGGGEGGREGGERREGS